MPTRIATPSGRTAKCRALAILTVVTLAMAGTALAGALAKAGEIPHVGRQGHENFEFYRQAGRNKAYAIAPGGAWAWSAEAVSEEEAAEQAVNDCQSHTRQKCTLYALNERIVFDREQWKALWGPYANADYAAQAPVGVGVGQRFYPLAWKDAAGKRKTLDELKGKIVFLHFWGSWCPPCLREFPSLQVLESQLRTKFGDDVATVLLQIREPYARSRQWARDNGFSNLPLFDSGTTDDEAGALVLADGNKIADRKVARVFPTSYVLDRQGLVVFSHYGPVADWNEYLPFFADAVGKTEYSAHSR